MPSTLHTTVFLWRRLCEVVPPARRGAFLQASVARLAPGNPPAVQIGACKAVAQLCKTVPPQELQGVSQHMFAGACAAWLCDILELSCSLPAAGGGCVMAKARGAGVFWGLLPPA
jgi:hypothetical protein